jgi:hypothetical protein
VSRRRFPEVQYFIYFGFAIKELIRLLCTTSQKVAGPISDSVIVSFIDIKFRAHYCPRINSASLIDE